MTDVLPDKSKEKQNIVSGNIGRTSSVHLSSDRKIVPRSSSIQQNKMIGIRISCFDRKPEPNYLKISLKQLEKQEKMLIMDKIRPSPRISINQEFKKKPQLQILYKDPQNRANVLLISKKNLLQDQMIVNYCQKSSNSYFIKKQLQSLKQKNCFINDKFRIKQDLNEIQFIQNSNLIDYPMITIKTYPKQLMFTERQCSLKDLLKNNQKLKKQLINDKNDLNSTLDIPKHLSIQQEDKQQFIKNLQCQQQERLMTLFNSSDNQKNQTLKISEQSLQNEIDCQKQNIQPTKFNQNIQKLSKTLEQQTKLDKPSRLGILQQTVKIETEKQNSQKINPTNCLKNLQLSKEFQQDIINNNNILFINQDIEIFRDFRIFNCKIQTTKQLYQFQGLQRCINNLENTKPNISQLSLKPEENKQILIIKPIKVNQIKECLSMQQVEPESLMDKISRLGILLGSQQIKEKQQINIINQSTIQQIKFQQIVRDIGQRKPNELQLSSKQNQMIDSVQFESQHPTKINLIKISQIQADEVSITNKLGIVFNSKILQLEQEVQQNKSIEISYFNRSQKLSEDFSNQQNLINYTETSFMDRQQEQNYRVQPKINIQHENNLERNRKKIEEIKQLISSSKKTNPLVLMNYNKQNQIREQKLEIEIPKTIRNFSVRSNDRRQPATGQTTPIRNSSNERQPSYMQMSKNNKSALNRFKKIKYLGRGNISDVYSVIDTTTGMIGALKTIQKSLISSKGIQGLVKTEIIIQSYINHPNILKCFGIINDDKQIALVLELGDITLYNYRKEKKLQEKQIIDIVYQILKGVDFLHQNGIIHRDIKPENILLQGSVVKLADLGICIKALQSQQYCGTPGFIAPEILNNQAYDSKVDCYSIGVILHELVFGKLPKQGQKIYGDTQLIKLMNGLLEINPQKRISCQQALELDLFKLCTRKLQKQTEMIKNTILWDF